MPEISGNAAVVLEKRYLVRDGEGSIVETPAGMFGRIAKFIASADFNYGKSHDEVSAVATRFYEMMASLEFIPNSPTLMNAGRPLGQLAACFVLPVGDSMEDIFDAIKNMALIHKSGGGTGFSFSRLRPKNDMVRSTTGVSSGPVSFMNIFNAATETVKQGGTRRGANMAILAVDHPDILEFISAKEDGGVLTNFNCSVALTDEFMRAVENNGEYDLVNPRTGGAVARLGAKRVFDLIVKKAWQNGEPGIVFIDRINDSNPLKKVGRIESTNPCGEQPLLPYESCNLGSINLARCVSTGDDKPSIDYAKLAALTRDAVHFLDNVVDQNRYPLPEIREMTLSNRKIGLGIMGFADMLVRLGVPYDSDEAIDIAEGVMSAIQEESKKASRGLAAERGAFPNFARSEFAERKEAPIRNATTTTIAPTGTISIIADTTSGIEPIFALAFVRNVMDNSALVEINPLFEKVAREQGFYSEAVMKRVAAEGTAAHIAEVPEEARKVFVTAHDIEPESHVKAQAAFQRFVDNAVSKTVNFPNTATVGDIDKVYRLAYAMGCKGVTVYRDGSRENQVLEVKREAAPGEAVAGAPLHLLPRSRGEVTFGSTRKMSTGCGALYVTINQDDEGLFEVFATMGKSGGCAASQTEAVSRLISLSLRCGIEPEQVIKQLKGVRCPNQAWEKGGRIYSCADAIAKALERHLGVDAREGQGSEAAKNAAETNGKGSDAVMVGVCPDCYGPLEFESGCSVCRMCGFSRCG
ncbi:MAG TPA: vitamin B12-dependent ribonucleotide reductase [Spirochaetota bacterium]|nr:vitamin B12-dependent ribonucleotide reductase [Spirochaetota bacterium]